MAWRRPSSTGVGEAATSGMQPGTTRWLGMCTGMGLLCDARMARRWWLTCPPRLTTATMLPGEATNDNGAALGCGDELGKRRHVHGTPNPGGRWLTCPPRLTTATTSSSHPDDAPRQSGERRWHSVAALGGGVQLGLMATAAGSPTVARGFQQRRLGGAAKAAVGWARASSVFGAPTHFIDGTGQGWVDLDSARPAHGLSFFFN